MMVAFSLRPVMPHKIHPRTDSDSTVLSRGIIARLGGLRRSLAGVLRHTDCRLFSEARARLTFSRISAALAVQMKGLGFSLCWSM
jgi:hypothetical protein